MRVDLLVHAFPPDSTGGTELYALRLALGLANHGHRVRVLTYGGAPGADHAAAGQPIEAAHAPGDPASGYPKVVRLRFSLDDTDNPMRDEYDNPRVAEFVRAQWSTDLPDIVHVAHCGYLSSAPLAVAAELGIPSLVTLTDLWALCPVGTLLRHDGRLCTGPQRIGQCVRCITHMGPRAARFARWTDALPAWALGTGVRLAHLPPLRRVPAATWLAALAQRADHIRTRMLTAHALLSPSRFQIALFERNGYPAGSIRWAPHGIPAPHTLRAAQPPPVGDDEPLRLGYIGPLEAHKGAHLPLEAFVHLAAGARATLRYAGALPGPGRDEAYARALLARIQQTPNVVHTGPFPNQDVGAALDGLDVLIVPSLCYENTPTIIYEALAHGTPVLGSDQGGVRELIEQYSGGWLFPRGDAQSLAQQLRLLVADPVVPRIAAAAIRPVPDMATHIDSMDALYREVTHAS